AGEVTAAVPILAVEDIETTYPVPVERAAGHDVFLLKVLGESMSDGGLLDGELALVPQQQTGRSCDMIVAWQDEYANMKRFFKEENQISLQPENQFMDPIIVHDIGILGKVIGLFREI